jgi:hypothetical protein
MATTPLIPFKNVQIASNESIDYYTLNRSFTRLYDAITTASGNATNVTSVPSTIPYSTLDSAGFVTFTDTVSGISNNKVISVKGINDYINSTALTSLSSQTIVSHNAAVFEFTSGAGILLNNIKFQYGYKKIPLRSNLFPFAFGDLPYEYAAGHVQTVDISYINTGSKKFTYTPHIMYQICDSSESITNYRWNCTITNATTGGCSIHIHITEYGSNKKFDKQEYYLTWLALGI